MAAVVEDEVVVQAVEMPTTGEGTTMIIQHHEIQMRIDKVGVNNSQVVIVIMDEEVVVVNKEVGEVTGVIPEVDTLKRLPNLKLDNV